MVRKSKEEIAEAYRAAPWWYDARGFFILTFAYNDTLWRQVKFFANNIGETHLDVACGTGTLLEFAYRYRKWRGDKPAQITGVDYAEAMLNGAIHRFRKRQDVTFQHADAANMPFEDGYFERATIMNSIHALPDPLGALKDMYRVLKPGGTLAANVLLYPDGFSPLRAIAQRINNWGKRRGILTTPYRATEIRALFAEAGFTLAQEWSHGNCFYLVAKKQA